MRKSRKLLVALAALFVIPALSWAERVTNADVGGHPVEIIETEGAGGSSNQQEVDGKIVFTYGSPGLSLILKDEVLTVNGRKYPLPAETSSVRIEDGEVEIDGREAKPE